MNTRPVIETSPGNTSLSAVFNDDATCFAVGLETGFCDFNAGIGLASMLGQTNYVALVGGGRKPKFPQNKIIIWDDSKQRIVITLDFPSAVLRTLLSKSLIVVALHNSIQVYQFSTTPRKIHEFETGHNSDDGLVCLAPDIIAFPGRTAGQVQLVDLKSGSVSIIPAHETKLRALALSRDGLLLATAGEKGTLIRLYATSNCAKIAEFRRGIDPAEIYSISFNPSNSLLAVTSDNATFELGDEPLRTPSSALRQQIAANGEGNNTPWGKPTRGLIGWASDDEVVVISAGRVGRWEKFAIVEDDEGKRFCVRKAWKQFLKG
ncbi:Phosphatidylinositol 3,5-bisphosphate-binding protein [Ascosphaera aggregata]|nr:Phosphatidylinositol 3,5-bisphosphate-binding protein [Ascosphaera aggregata]